MREGGPMPDGEAGMGTRDPAVIQADIARAREEIARSVLTLRERMSEARDWRTYVRKRPVLVVGAALALGFWLGWRGAS
ncbi:MAG: DUF3618 domain-containing protein [Myxococcales bacterium]